MENSLEGILGISLFFKIKRNLRKRRSPFLRTANDLIQEEIEDEGGEQQKSHGVLAAVLADSNLPDPRLGLQVLL